MLDHVGVAVRDSQRSEAFYEKALAPLGLTLPMEPVGEAAGFGGAAPAAHPTTGGRCRAQRGSLALTARAVPTPAPGWGRYGSGRSSNRRPGGERQSW
jgi:catechol 2,3-dioxygenase-like lactoylglutathione lyase family enzyme